MLRPYDAHYAACTILMSPLITRGSHSLSVRATYTAAVRSPHTLTVVRHMSRIRSTPRMTAMPSGGTPTVASTTIKSGNDPPGTPAAPTAVMTLSTSTTICVPRSSDTPNTCARKRTVTPSYSAVPFMHIVEPRGSTKPAILGGILNSSSATAMLVGRVALLELVEKAVTMLARIRLQNTRGDRPPSTRTNRVRLTAPWSSRPNNTTRTYLERLWRMPQPNIEVVKKIRPNTPYG